MNFLENLFGAGTDLTVTQMTLRGIGIFFIALCLIRISGRRSFGLRTPFDNIIAISLGAILSRAVVGASPFLATVVTCAVISFLHRVLAWLTIRNKTFRRLVEGEKILLYDHTGIHRKNLSKALICEEDVLEGIRKSIQTNDLKKAEKIFMERNGEISATRPNEQ